MPAAALHASCDGVLAVTRSTLGCLAVACAGEDARAFDVLPSVRPCMPARRRAPPHQHCRPDRRAVQRPGVQPGLCGRRLDLSLRQAAAHAGRGRVPRHHSGAAGCHDQAPLPPRPTARQYSNARHGPLCSALLAALLAGGAARRSARTCAAQLRCPVPVPLRHSRTLAMLSRQPRVPPPPPFPCGVSAGGAAGLHRRPLRTARLLGALQPV